LQIKTKNVSCHTADSKPVKQEVNSTVILPVLVFPELAFALLSLVNSCITHHIFNDCYIKVGLKSDEKSFYETMSALTFQQFIAVLCLAFQLSQVSHIAPTPLFLIKNTSITDSIDFYFSFAFIEVLGLAVKNFRIPNDYGQTLANRIKGFHF
jgi:hypothetical protein